MKWIITGLLLLSAMPIFASDSLSYEELPECFLNFDVWADEKTKLQETSGNRALSVDTCKALDIEGLSQWFNEATGQAALSYVHMNRDDLLSNNGFYSNQLMNLQCYENSTVTSIFKDSDSLIATEEVQLEDLRDKFKYLKNNYFDIIKEKYGDFKIFGDYSEVNDSVYRIFRFHLVFDKYVSMMNLINLSKVQSIQTFDQMISIPLTVEEKKDSKSDFIVTNDYIQLKEISKPGILKIFNLTGQLIKETNLTLSSSTQIGISDLRDGLYFIVFNNSFHKFIKGSM